MSDDIEVQRVLTVFCNETEELVAEHRFASFDLPSFKQHFDVKDDHDPYMYLVYPVASGDVEFISQYFSKPMTFVFDEYSYYVEAATA